MAQFRQVKNQKMRLFVKLKKKPHDVSDCEGGYAFTYHRENPGEGDNYFVDVYRFVKDFDESELDLQQEETAGYKIADLKKYRSLLNREYSTL